MGESGGILAIMQTVEDIRKRLREADAEEFSVLERSLLADTRKGVKSALEAARRRLASEAAENERLANLYEFEAELAGGGVAVGLDEVGRGPVAGPLTVGAVVLPREPRIEGLNDSKQLSPAHREELSLRIREVALAWTVQHVSAGEIDTLGMSRALKQAFSQAIAAIEAQGIHADAVLIDGNPLHIDPREHTVVKGDARCASIAAASIVAKVERDALMCELAKQYPAYGFESHKGYASAEHIEAIKQYGLSPVHRATFCTAFTQETLF